MGNSRLLHLNALEQAERVADEPENFAISTTALVERLRHSLKSVYDAVQYPQAEFEDSLSTLVVDGLHCEQIWEELELRSSPLLNRARREIKEAKRQCKNAEESKVDSVEENCSPEPNDAERQEIAEEDEDLDNGMDDDISEDKDEEEEEEAGSIDLEDDEGRVDEDLFFNAQEMEDFADEAEQLEEEQPNRTDKERDGGDEENEEDSDSDEDENEINLFADIGSGDEDADKSAKYSAFFDPIDGEQEHDDDGSETALEQREHLSEFQQRQLEMRERIAELERANVTTRGWELMGETTAADRPEDALLDVPLEVEMADKQAQVITEQVTQALEDVIRQRVIDEAFDDVERRTEPKTKAMKARSELETSKSSVGLAEVYEKEYIAKVLDRDEADEELGKEHREIAEMFASVCHSLDALSNFHYTARKPVEHEIVTSSAPAILMEEAVPITAAAGAQAAPEEIQKAVKALTAGESEMTHEERRKKRRDHKTKRAKQLAQKREDTPRDKRQETIAAAAAAGTAADARKSEGKIDADAINYARSKNVFKRLQELKERPQDSKKQKQKKSDSAASKPRMSAASFKM